ncbi:MAG: NADH-quinone oxidoreductase subunit NuoG [Gemmatimonadota bacterium]
MGKIWIDGRVYDADSNRNVLEVALSRGFDLPYFCWHPALGSVGACRQCAVKQFEDEGDEEGRLVMACMTSASDGTRVSITDPDAYDFRARVVEWLMVNHPHDCPVCDEGGECHLQDMTVMTGHNYRRYRFPKRTYRNQDLGPFINHEMNRCIQCYRCVRFYDEYAGGRDLQAFAAHDRVYFGRVEDGTLDSEFSGNLVEICPTGVFTDKSLKAHYTRKWDLRTAPSVCQHCSLGCNTTPGERYGTLRRIRSRFNEKVNGYFLCDRGRYGYEFVNHRRRVRHPVRPKGGEDKAVEVGVDEALAKLGALLKGPERVLGIGSPRASLEANFALRAAVGADAFYRGESRRETELADAVLGILRDGGARSLSLGEVEEADAVLVLGEDPTNTAPMLELALRQAVRNQPLAGVREDGAVPPWHDHAVREAVQDRKGPLFVITAAPARLDEIARHALRRAPKDVARMGRAVARALDPDAPAVEGLSDEETEAAREMADALRDARRPLVVSGTGAGSREVLAAAGAVADALAATHEDAGIVLVLPECNTLGTALLGGKPLEAAFHGVEEESVGGVVILENDLFRRAPREAVERFLGVAPLTVVLDQLAHETGERAELVLPAATFAEGDGTLVNHEGRAQRFVRVFVPNEGEIRESWRWLGDAAATALGTREAAPTHAEEPADARGEARAAGAGGGVGTGRYALDREPEGFRGPDQWRTLRDVQEALARDVPALAAILDAFPDPDFRVAGARVPRELHRYSGRTAMRAHSEIHEPAPPPDPDSPLSFSMEGYLAMPPPKLASEFWSPGWNSVQALNRFQEEVGGPLRGGPAGVRVLEPSGSVAFRKSGSVPRPFEPRNRQDGGGEDGRKWRVVPLHHCFGSEELSVLSAGVAQRAPDPYVALAPEDAEELGVGSGSPLTVELDGVRETLPVRLWPGLIRGCMGLPFGLPGVGLVQTGNWVRVLPDSGDAGGKETGGEG